MAMVSWTLRVPEELKDGVEAEAKARGFGNVSEYVRAKLRGDVEDRAEMDAIEDLDRRLARLEEMAGV